MQEMWIWSLGQEDPLEEEVATHSSILIWKIPSTEEYHYQSTVPWGLKESDMTEHTQLQTVKVLPFCFQLHSFSSVIAVISTSHTILNRSVESEHPCLGLDFKEKVFSFSLLNVMLTIGLLYTVLLY